MNCRTIRDELGIYLDGEANTETKRRIESHLAECASCRDELGRLHAMTSALSDSSPPKVPEELWNAIEHELDHSIPVSSSAWRRWIRRRPSTVAAVLLLGIGLATAVVIWPGLGTNRAHASTVNFGIILEALPLDPNKAVNKFLALYEGAEIPASQMRTFAPGLTFKLPDHLPGGFRRTATYGLDFGGTPGLLARYGRGDELLVVIIHRAIHEEDFGTHKDNPCVIGEHRGHKVSVGQWSLVHVTDPTTCHCVLSRLEETGELPKVLTAVAPPTDAASEHPH